MNYEFEDYRKPKKEPELGPWTSYRVPRKFCFDYIVKFLLYLWILPWAFGIQLTVIGLLFNTVIYDYISVSYTHLTLPTKRIV